MTFPLKPQSVLESTGRLGFVAALISTMAGTLYFLVILFAIMDGGFTFPPEKGLQLFGGIISLIICPVLVIMMTSLHVLIPAEKKAFSQASLGFTLLFALSVSTNRFSQLGVVRQAENAGHIEGVTWFQAYGDFSIMLGLEYLGWAWFLGLAMLCAAPLFHEGRLQRWLRGLMIAYGLLGLVSSLGFLLGTWLSLLGFVAWGVVLYIITALLVVYFRRKY
jgi:hypothetical protein